MIWTNKPTEEMLKAFIPNTAVENMGIEYTEIGDDFLSARMPVDDRTVQPFRILHGGASCVLAETLGSVASMFCLPNPDTHMSVGVEINANHLRPATGGFVYGTCKPIRIGKRIHVWNIEIKNEGGKLICVSRLTIAVVEQFKDN